MYAQRFRKDRNVFSLFRKMLTKFQMFFVFCSKFPYFCRDNKFIPCGDFYQSSFCCCAVLLA